MSADVKALVERLHYATKHIAFEAHRDHAILAMAEAILLIEAQQREIERLREREAELHGQLQRMIDRWEGQHSLLADATARFETIKAECLRENARPPHIKRCAFVQASGFLDKQGRGG